MTANGCSDSSSLHSGHMGVGDAIALWSPFSFGLRMRCLGSAGRSTAALCPKLGVWIAALFEAGGGAAVDNGWNRDNRDPGLFVIVGSCLRPNHRAAVVRSTRPGCLAFGGGWRAIFWNVGGGDPWD